VVRLWERPVERLLVTGLTRIIHVPSATVRLEVEAIIVLL
jgi:hypothetical protein